MYVTINYALKIHVHEDTDRLIQIESIQNINYNLRQHLTSSVIQQPENTKDIQLRYVVSNQNETLVVGKNNDDDNKIVIIIQP